MSKHQLISPRTFTRIAILQTSLLILALIVLGYWLRVQVRETYLDSLHTNVVDLVDVLGKEFPEKYSDEWCESTGHGAEFRFSIINAKTGVVICDNKFPLHEIPRILDREEIQSAIHSPNHRGISLRNSLLANNQHRLYAAQYFPNQDLVMRIGFSVQTLEQSLTNLDQVFFSTILIVSVVLIFILLWLTRGFLFRRTSQAIQAAGEKLQRELVANVTHEFRTPLTSILGFAKSMRADLIQGEKINPEHLQIIHSDSERLLLLVDDLLDLSAIDSGMLSVRKEWCSTQEATEEALKRLQVIYGEKKQIVQPQFLADTVFADPNRLHQILINLIGNSMKYCAQGTKIEVVWKDESDLITLHVFDHGVGLNSSEREQLFSRFLRFSKGALQPHKSSGLGLAIVKGLVDAHGGHIQWISPTAQGFGLKLSFPKEKSQPISIDSI